MNLRQVVAGFLRGFQPGQVGVHHDPDAVRGQPGAMADASNVRHDTIVVPERMSPAQVRRGRSGRLKFKSATTTWWPVLHLHGSRPVGGEYGTEVEWRYSYQVIPPGGAATDTAD